MLLINVLYMYGMGIQFIGVQYRTPNEESGNNQGVEARMYVQTHITENIECGSIPVPNHSRYICQTWNLALNDLMGFIYE